MKIAINGFGRIGRMFFRHAFDHADINIVAVNDLGEAENLAYLLRYDTVYGPYEKMVTAEDGKLVVDGTAVKVLNEKEPSHLPWSELGIDVAIESTGVFDTVEGASLHLAAGAKRVVLTAPFKGETG